MGWFIGWIVGSFIAGFIGDARKIGFGWAFFLSLILSPLLGIIIAIASERKSDSEHKKVMEQTLAKPIVSDLEKMIDLHAAGKITSEELDSYKKKVLT